MWTVIMGCKAARKVRAQEWKRRKEEAQFVRAVLLLCRQRALCRCATTHTRAVNMAHMWPVEPERKQNRNLCERVNCTLQAAGSISHRTGTEQESHLTH